MIRQVLSVSRRTDIPAFYMPWFMEGIRRGTIDVTNPYNRQTRSVPVSPDRVHSIVFWSKNFGPFLKGHYGERLQDMGYHLLFNFTVNSRAMRLEPGVPELDQRLNQLRQLCGRFGAHSVLWRFDPICHWRLPGGEGETNLGDFAAIAAAAGSCGVKRCVTSFMDHYRKIERRTRNQLTFYDPATAEKLSILQWMEERLAKAAIRLALCCEKDVLKRLPAGTTIGSGACISGRWIMAHYGGKVPVGRDAGQRQASGCGCTISVDVGTYDRHPCYHNCLFCYANPACDRRGRR